MFWDWTYTIQIMEERPDETIAWILDKKTNSLKKAYQIVYDTIDKMKYPPHSIIIYKDWRGHTVPTTPFKWGDYPSFNIADFYL